MSAFKSLFGKAFGIEVSSDKIQATKGLVLGGNGEPKIILGDASTAAWFEDFIGSTDTGAPQGIVKVAGDTGVNHGGVEGGPGGIYRITLGDTPAAAAATAGGGITAGRNFQINSGPNNTSGRTRVGARIKASNFNDTGRRLSLFFGLTDTGLAQMPIFDTGGATVVSAASNAVGFIIGSRADTGVSGVAVSGDTDRTAVALDTGALAPGKWTTLEVELTRGPGDTGGTATFFIDGRVLGSISSPVASEIGLAPSVYAFPEDTGGGMVIDVDWIGASTLRDTGS